MFLCTGRQKQSSFLILDSHCCPGCDLTQAVWDGLHLLPLSDRELPGTDDHAPGGRLAFPAATDLRCNWHHQRPLGLCAPRDPQHPFAWTRSRCRGGKVMWDMAHYATVTVLPACFSPVSFPTVVLFTHPGCFPMRCSAWDMSEGTLCVFSPVERDQAENSSFIKPFTTRCVH